MFSRLSRFARGGRAWRILAAFAAVAAPACGADSKGDAMSYSQVREFLLKHTHVVELAAGDARVAVCPAWQGRVMTSTCAGPAGRSFGFVNSSFIEAGKLDPHFNNYGGEERMWLSPEGGPLSLWFKPGAPRDLAHWFTPPALNEGGWKVISGPHEPACRMEARMAIQNSAGTHLLLDVQRTVRLLAGDEFRGVFGDAAARLAGQSDVKMVAYETINKVINRGDPWARATGLVSVWMLGMFNAGQDAVVIVPYRAGPEQELGPAVRSDYFGTVPPERLKVLPTAALFRADAKCRAKIGTSQRRARDVLGSIDFHAGVLTLVQFSMPADPTQCDYLNNMWDAKLEQPYAGDVANSYNDGPTTGGKQMGAFYEIESLSPAPALAHDEELVHKHRTVHIQADPATLAALAQTVLGVDLAVVKQEMLGK